MKTSEFNRRLKAAGCYILREGGRHTIWYNPTTDQKFAVPRHQSKEVIKGVLLNAKKALGLE